MKRGESWMSYDMSLDDEGEFIRLRLHGIRNKENMKLIWQRIVELSRDSMSQPVLVEDHMRGSLSPVHFFSLEKKVRETGIPRSLKVAVADLRTEKTYEDDRFAETVAFNCGWNNVRVFKTVDEAVEWLAGSRSRTSEA
jgi:hypothetical protein